MKRKIKEFIPVKVYEDEAHETKTRQEMEVARTYLQVVLSEYLKFDIGVPDDINMLLMRPEIVFNRRLQALVDAPETGGKFAIKKSAYMNTLELPDPAALYAACSIAKKQMWAAVPLWAISDDGKTVILNEREAMQYIDSQSIYADTPEKAKLVKDLQRFCDLWNELNTRLNGELISPVDSFINRWAMNKFQIKEYAPGMRKIELDRGAINRWISTQ